MPRRQVQPGRLRRRLTMAFVLVAGISAGALAAGSFLLVREARLRDSLRRAQSEARLDIGLAANTAFGRGVSPEGFVATYRAQRGVDVVLVTGGQRFPSNPMADPPLPADLQRLVVRGDLAYRRVVAGGRHLLLIGGHAPGSNADVYLVASEDSLATDLAILRNVLVGGWVVVMILAGLVGRLLARRTLEPVARASEAARSMAEGLLATRLPVEGRDEFGSWATSFNEMAEALEAKVAALSEAQARERRFTSDVAHELRTPLTALVGAASLLRDHLDEMPGEARRPAELLIRDVARLRRLVDELMEISRLDSGHESIAAETIDLTLLAAAVVRTRGWEARVDLRGQRVVLSTDRRRVERIVANLVGNALEHGGRDVRVRVGRSDSHAVLAVSDEGPGIAPEHLSHLFERFYKSDPSRTSPGSGLGLAISLENARLLGGDIDVQSEPGLGSRFTLRLPIAVTEPLPEGEPADTQADHHEAHSRQKGADE